MNQKGFAPLVFILVIVLLSAGIIGGSWYFSKTKQLKSVQSSSVDTINNQKLQNIASTSSNPKTIASDPTASWKVFTDKNNIYSIKYPGEVLVSNSCSEYRSELTLNKKIPTDKLDLSDISDCGRKPSFQIIPDNVEVYKIFSAKPSSTEDIKLDGINARKYIFSNGILVQVTFSNITLNLVDFDQNDSQLFDQIISTFSLLDKVLLRDIKRLQDLSLLQNAINVSVQESTVDFEKNNIWCKGSGSSSSCFGSSLTNDKHANGEGWIKMDLTAQKRVPINELPIDPINDNSFHYAYCAGNDLWEINTVLESPKYAEKMKNDGGDDDNKYEVGANLTIFNKNSQCKY